MELDEFKLHWNAIQQKEIEEQKLTNETLNNLIMKTTSTLAEIQKTNAFWNKSGTAICASLIGILVVNLAISFFVPKYDQTYSQSVIPVIVMIVFAATSIWCYKRQQQIFDIRTDENLKEVLTKTLADFKRFYLLYNLIYIVLFPAYYYAFIVLFWGFLKISTINALFISTGLTVISFIINHWYYKVKYFSKIKILKDTLDELS